MNAEITFYKKTRGRIAVQFPEDLHYDFCVNGFFVEQSDNEIRFFKNNGSYEGGRLRRQDKDRPIPLPFNRGTPRDFNKKYSTPVEFNEKTGAYILRLDSLTDLIPTPSSTNNVIEEEDDEPEEECSVYLNIYENGLVKPGLSGNVEDRTPQTEKTVLYKMRFQLEDRYPTKKIATDVEGYLKDACRPWRINDKGPNHEYLENPPLTMIFSYMKALRTKFNGKEIQR